ncbi:hypothetical protein MBLNU459_g8164t1 [Dothideomycetes sp. NU459]
MHLYTGGLWLPILIASRTLASSAPSYFNITDIGNLMNSHHEGGFEGMGFSIVDPATNTGTYCGVDFNSTLTNTVDGYAPIEWTKCENPTFSFRFESYFSTIQYRVGIRHQYRGLVASMKSTIAIKDMC